MNSSIPIEMPNHRLVRRTLIHKNKRANSSWASRTSAAWQVQRSPLARRQSLRQRSLREAGVAYTPVLRNQRSG
jgi:hypothetical protein